jgi:hypothetical protein
VSLDFKMSPCPDTSLDRVKLPIYIELTKFFHGRTLARGNLFTVV